VLSSPRGKQKQLADVTFSRYAKLYEEKGTFRAGIRSGWRTQKKIAESELERAKAMLREAQTYQEYAHVRAPFAGVVTGKKIDAGSMANAGDAAVYRRRYISFLSGSCG